MNHQTGMFRCFRCEEKGNNYGFIRAIHKHWYLSTTDDQYLDLCRIRKFGIDVPVLKELQLAYNRTTEEWLIPSWAKDSAHTGIVNLYRYSDAYDERSGQMRKAILSGPGFKHHSYGGHRVRHGAQRPIWVLEGHWDYLAFVTLLHRTNQAGSIDAVAAPGAGTFPASDLDMFNGRKVVIVFDNDEPGQRGKDQLLTNMHKHGVAPLSLHTLKWPADLPSGFDVNDAMHSLPAKYCKSIK